MGEAKRRRAAECQHLANHKFQSTFDACNEFVECALRGSNSPHVVVGPVVWQPSDGKSGKRWYFHVSTSEPKRGFRCDQLGTDGGKDDCEFLRANVFLALIAHRPLVVHDMDDELAAAKLCEALWPGNRITKLRQTVEAERAETGK